MIKKRYKVCVLLAAYNCEKWIEEQVKTIFKQRGVKIYLYISLDLSSDNSFVVIQNLKKIYKNINLIYSKKRFGNAAQNFFYLLKFVNFKKYDFISLSDQDDIWFDCKIINSIKCLIRYKCSGYASNVLAYRNSKIISLINKSQKQKKYDYFFEGGGPGCTFVLPREVAEDIQTNIKDNRNLVKKMLFHDWYIYFFIRCRHERWFIDKKPSMLYRQHASNELGANIGLKSYYKRIKFIFSGNLFKQIELLCKCCMKRISNKCKKNLLNKKKSIFFFIWNFAEFRRKRKDQFIFLLLIIFLFLTKRI